ERSGRYQEAVGAGAQRAERRAAFARRLSPEAARHGDQARLIAYCQRGARRHAEGSHARYRLWLETSAPRSLSRPALLRSQPSLSAGAGAARRWQRAIGRGQSPPARARQIELRDARPALRRHRRSLRRDVAAASRKSAGAPRRGTNGRDCAAAQQRNTRMSVSAERAPLSRLRIAGRLLVLALLFAGIVAVWLNRAALEPNAIRAAIEAHPAIAPLLFLLLHIVASLLFVPRTLMGLVAGGVFDFWWGLVWATTGSVLGAIAGFLIARYVNSGMIDLESLPKLGPVLQRAEAGGWRAVTMLRLIPVIPHSFSNYALGLTRLSLGGYALGSLLGQ